MWVWVSRLLRPRRSNVDPAAVLQSVIEVSNRECSGRVQMDARLTALESRIEALEKRENERSGAGKRRFEIPDEQWAQVVDWERVRSQN